MEIQDEKVYKTKKTVREAMKRYMDNMKENKQDQYMKKTEYHKAYNKDYYKKIKEERAQLKQLLEQIQLKTQN